MLIDALEVSVVLVALPSIGADLGLPVTTLQWAVSGFAAGFGGLLLFGSRVVALLGRRRVYLAALLVFAAASVVSGLTSDPGVLVATRFVKGFCAALTAPTGLAIITTTFPEGRARDRALSVYTLFGAGGFTAGLLLSGLLTQVSWRLTLLFPAPVVLVLFLLGFRSIPRSAGEAVRARHYDAAGAVAFAGAVLALVQGIVSVPVHGWADVRSTGLLCLGTVLLAVFGAVERAAPEPLIRFSVLANGAMVRSAVGAACLNGSYLGLLFVTTFQLQALQGWDPLRTALAFVPAAAPLAVTALLSGKLVNRFGTAPLIAVGALLPFLGYLLRLPHFPGYALGLLPTMLLVGAGFVLSFTALNAQATSELPPAERGAGSGLYQTAVQTGAMVVTALVAALLAAGLDPRATAAEAAAASRSALWLVVSVGALGLLVGLAGARPRHRRPAVRSGRRDRSPAAPRATPPASRNP
ncbi:MFS transporter [Streptomyces sp. TRM43335]|uniref:MFS transporter n=2 Tax=Streptomyces taklimakanensis TaxID=2569853 RepID=A0A6G2BFC2_9ACTN|nr:MFS transporter [Streptomyces taklimakanensis]MTE20987.1 MFS transporter [Streptomyces taklimakanensis]